MPSYPGGKNGAGVYQRLINLMPPHDVYIEPFLGGGALMRLKRPGALNIGVDRDPEALRWTRDYGTAGSAEIVRSAEVLYAIPAEDSSFQFFEAEAIAYLQRYRWTGRELVYCDPPYLMGTRSGKKLYRHEMNALEHRRLLRVVMAIPAMVMISGYPSPLYESALAGWNTIEFQAMTRGGRQATERCWYNYPTPIALHDYRYLGEGFRERERIKRKKRRWVQRLRIMPALERQALLAAIADSGITGVAGQPPF